MGDEDILAKSVNNMNQYSTLDIDFIIKQALARHGVQVADSQQSYGVQVALLWWYKL